jgi:tetratricopeptide (TPR) repeat protein
VAHIPVASCASISVGSMGVTAGQSRDTRLPASVHEMDGRCHESVGDHARALVAFRRSLDLFDSVEDRRGAASLTYFIGCAQLALGESELARETLARALGLLRDVGDSKMEGRALISIGRGLTDLGRDDEARSAFEQAVDVLVAGGDLFHESWAQEALADVAERAGDRRAARDRVA